MNEAVSSSSYDSASSRAQAPQAGAALKSTSTGLFEALAWASASSAFVSHCTFTVLSSVVHTLTYRGTIVPLERKPIRRAGKTPKSSTSHVFPSFSLTRAAGIRVPSP